MHKYVCIDDLLKIIWMHGVMENEAYIQSIGNVYREFIADLSYKLCIAEATMKAHLYFLHTHTDSGVR